MSRQVHCNDAQSSEVGPLKVLLVVGDYPPVPGGMSDQTGLLAKEFVQLGVRIAVLTTKVSGEPVRSVEEGVDVCRLMSRWHMSELGAVLRVLDELGPGAVVSVMYGDWTTRRRPLVNFLPLLLRLLRPSCRVIVNIQEFRTRKFLWRAWAAPMILTAHGLVFVDPPDRGSLLRWTTLRRPTMECIPVVSNIVPVPVTGDLRRAWRQRLGILGETPIVTFFGSFIPSKGLSVLLEAIKNVRRDGVPACLLLLGFFPYGYSGCQEFEKETREALSDGLSTGWIKLIEHCPAAAVSEYLHASDAAVFPFLRGARSNNTSVLAAATHGLPVITTQGIDTPEGFADEYGVALVPAGDETSLAGRLKQILLSDEEKTRLRTMASRAGRDYSWAALASKTMAFYDQSRVKSTSCQLQTI
ncbi:MAG: glycosyltransferase family 4 protein [Terracidiphilus sp.]